MIKIKSLFIYPVKSLGGISIDTMSFDDLGPEFDRRYMLIDEYNNMLTQREHPQLAKFKTNIIENSLKITHENDSIEIDLNQSHILNKSLSCTVWEDNAQGFEVDPIFSNWFSEKLEFKTKLVKFNTSQKRSMDRNFVNFDAQVGFADGFQILVAQQSSLEALELGSNEDMLRFRPNIVVEGADAFSEDFWREFSIDKNDFLVVKPCSRCLMPAINPINGSKQPEVIRALAQKRLFNKETYFGQNVVIKTKSSQSISINDPLTITKQSNHANIT